nr:UDP-4-amino-4,6-dideoxy-N-acetyl-beta-L-altrosamine N-acetyltransferase [uncultured Cohaesibacter sp.]
MAIDRVRNMKDGDLEIVLSWRNHPDVRPFMFDASVIKTEQHQSWFDKVSADPTRRLLIYEHDSQALGFIQFSEVEVGGISEWGFYKAPISPRGTGLALGVTALRFAFRTLGLHKVCGRVLAFNEGSHKMHRSLGFKQEGLLKDQHKLDNRYVDVYCYGLFQHDLVDSVKS